MEKKEKSLIYGTITACSSSLGQIAALKRFQMNGLILFHTTIEEITETMALAPTTLQHVRIEHIGMEWNRLE